MSRKARRRRGGQALVEFVLVVPIFLLLVMGVVDFGRCLQAYQAITDTARVTARATAVFDPMVTQAVAINMINDRLARARLDSTLATKTVQILPNGFPGNSGDTVVVSISYPYTFGFLAPFLSWTGADATVTLQTQLKERNE